MFRKRLLAPLEYRILEYFAYGHLKWLSRYGWMDRMRWWMDDEYRNRINARSKGGWLEVEGGVMYE